MLSIILFLCALSSGSILCAAVWERKYEETLPLTCTAIVLVLFFCGVLGHLLFGVYLVCALVAIAYVFSLTYLLRTRGFRKFLARIITPASVAFVGIYGILAWLNCGKLATAWDECSHWMDAAKTMTLFNDFGTNPSANLMFQSYPPGMTLFQYFLEKLFLKIQGGGSILRVAGIFCLSDF